MDKQKVLYILTKNDIGGAQKYVHDLATHLDATLFDVKILYGERDIASLSNRISFFFLNDCIAIYELVKIFQREIPHIIHLNSSKAGIIGTFAAAIYKLFISLNPKRYTLYPNPCPQNPKVVFTAHGWVFNPSNKVILQVRWFYILLHKLAGFAMDAIIVVSQADLYLAQSYHIVPNHKLALIYNGIEYQDLQFFDKISARRKLLSRIAIENEDHALQALWVGSIGRLTKEKDYETLIQAATHLPHIYFFILGTGELLLKYRRLIEKKKLFNSFFIIGDSKEAHRFLYAFDIFILPSVKEGLPYALLEACAAKLPSIVTNVGGMPEVIENNNSGYVVPQKKPRILAEKIELLSRNEILRKTLGENAYTRVQTEFSFSKMVEKTELVYTNILQIQKPN